MRCCSRSLHRLQPYQRLTSTQHQHCDSLHGAYLVPTLLFGEIQGPWSLTVQFCSVHMCMFTCIIEVQYSVLSIVGGIHQTLWECLCSGSACAITYEKTSCMQKPTCEKKHVGTIVHMNIVQVFLQVNEKIFEGL
jgi:hypothetical protein